MTALEGHFQQMFAAGIRVNDAACVIASVSEISSIWGQTMGTPVISLKPATCSGGRHRSAGVLPPARSPEELKSDSLRNAIQQAQQLLRERSSTRTREHDSGKIERIGGSDFQSFSGLSSAP